MEEKPNNLILNLIFIIFIIVVGITIFIIMKEDKIYIQECMILEGNFNQSYYIYQDGKKIESYSTGIKNGYVECKTEEIREVDLWKKINLERGFRK